MSARARDVGGDPHRRRSADPLVAPHRRSTKALAAIPHVKTLRWHSRLPVAAPERVTKAMARALVADGKTTVVAVHANHPRELTDAAARRLPPSGGCRSDAGQPERSSERRQRRSGDAHRLDARFRRGAGEALLPASRRPRAWHGALARTGRKGPGADAGLARDDSRGWRCRPTCSTFRAAGARSPSDRNGSAAMATERMSLPTRRERLTFMSIGWTRVVSFGAATASSDQGPASPTSAGSLPSAALFATLAWASG